MDLANFSKRLSGSLTQEIYRDCNMACFQESTYNPDTQCLKNCSSKAAQFLSAFEKITKTEVPKLQESSRIQ